MADTGSGILGYLNPDLLAAQRRQALAQMLLQKGSQAPDQKKPLFRADRCRKYAARSLSAQEVRSGHVVGLSKHVQWRRPVTERPSKPTCAAHTGDGSGWRYVRHAQFQRPHGPCAGFFACSKSVVQSVRAECASAAGRWAGPRP